jgi:outer membrane cobalamin receptor
MAAPLRMTIRTALLSSTLLAAQPAWAQAAEQQTPPEAQQPMQVGVQDDSAEPEDDRSLEEIIVTGRIGYRNRTQTVAPELSYDHEFFQKFEPSSVGDSLKRVPGVSFSSDIGEYDLPALRGLGAGFTQILVNGRPIPGAGNDRTVFVDRIPAEIIDRIEIIRSPSADIDSEGIGGTINIILKDGESLPPGIIGRAGLLYYTDDNTFKGSGAFSISGRNEAETVAYSITLDAQQRYNPKVTYQDVFDDNVPGFEQSETGLDLFRPFDRAGSIGVEREEQTDTRRSFDLSLNSDVTFNLSPENELRLSGFFIRTRRHDIEHTLKLERDTPDDPWEIDEIGSSPEPHKQENFGLSAEYDGALDDTTKIEGLIGYSQFKDESGDFLYTYDDDGVDPLTFQPDDLSGRDDGVLTESEEMTSSDKELSLDGSITKEIGKSSIKVGFAGKLKDRHFTDAAFEDLDTDEPADVTEGSGAFSYKERRLDGYIVADWALTDRIKLETGARA